MVTVLSLLTACGGSSGSDKKTNIDEKGALAPLETGQSVAMEMMQVLSQSGDDSDIVSVQKDVLHLVDGDMLHLTIDKAALGIKDMILSFRWMDMDGNVLGQTGMFEQIMHYDPMLDSDGDGVCKYIKKVIVVDMMGNVFSKSYTVFVHRSQPEGGQALLGPLAQAHYTLTQLHDQKVIDEGTTTQGDGQDVQTAGVIPLSAKVLNSLNQGYYLLTVAGGEDIDKNDDQIWDETPVPVSGALHAIVTAKELQTGNFKVNILAQAIYEYLKSTQNLSQISDEALTKLLDQYAQELLAADINGDGVEDYRDIVQWNPVTDKKSLAIDYAKNIQPYIDKVLYKTIAEKAVLLKKYVVDKKVMNGQEITYRYDSNGNVVEERIQEALQPPVVVQYANQYDSQGRLIEQRRKDTQVATRWIYNTSGDLTEKVVGIYDASENFSIYERYFYKNGKLSSGRINRGEVLKNITYEADVYGNVIKETIAWFGQTFVVNYTYEYDDAGRVLKKYKNGQLLFEQNWKVL